MSWNEPGGGNKGPRDPWGGGNQGPPDLDEAFKKLQQRLSGMFGGGRGGSGSVPGVHAVMRFLLGGRRPAGTPPHPRGASRFCSFHVGFLYTARGVLGGPSLFFSFSFSQDLV